MRISLEREFYRTAESNDERNRNAAARNCRSQEKHVGYNDIL